MAYQTKPSVAIIGAGAAGLMAADFLACYDVDVCVFEQLPSAGRKLLMAGKTGLNLSNTKPFDEFVAQYRPHDWLVPFIAKYDTAWLLSWLDELGVATFVGSSGRIFPTAMKAAPFLRAWLSRLQNQGVRFYYRHRCLGLAHRCLTLVDLNNNQRFERVFDVVILACGGGSYARLGGDGAWPAWFNGDELSPLFASNIGVCRTWSSFMSPMFGQAIKRVRAWVDSPKERVQGDVVISHYGLESGVIYQLNHQLRQKIDNNQPLVLYFDLLPDVSQDKVYECLANQNHKQTLNNRWRKVGLDGVKMALLRECSDKNDWHNPSKMACAIKALAVGVGGFRPMDEAISTGGGIKQTAVNDKLQLKSNPCVFVAGEMLAWDAPTGGYLLTACFATGRAVGEAVASHLGLNKKCSSV